MGDLRGWDQRRMRNTDETVGKSSFEIWPPQGRSEDGPGETFGEMLEGPLDPLPPLSGPLSSIWIEGGRRTLALAMALLAKKLSFKQVAESFGVDWKVKAVVVKRTTPFSLIHDIYHLIFENLVNLVNYVPYFVLTILTVNYVPCPLEELVNPVNYVPSPDEVNLVNYVPCPLEKLVNPVNYVPRSD